MRLSAYDYPLPESLIARYPLPERDQSRMLTLGRASGEMAHRRFEELPQLLAPGDLVVLNNTRVLPSRLIGHREGFSGRVEVLMLHPAGGNEDPLVWEAMARPARKLAPGTRIVLNASAATLTVVSRAEEGRVRVRVDLGEEFSSETESGVYALMARVGQIPIPPYLRREAEAADAQTYQTIFAKAPGAQAAPTAGLHFTEKTLAALRTRGVEITEITLAVSSGTFRHVTSDDITQHRMDPEHYDVSPQAAQAIEATRARGGRVVAIGTTVTKTLETVASRHGGRIVAEAGWSELFIHPGFTFQTVDAMLTNFHLPQTTLLMLVSAFAGRDRILAAYHEAIAQSYRFYSYGDCMLLI
ncbi:MAG: tRNA preQ1(34) S-adenosylmethionine ribosyltransferase-isomerase QueA [Vampirovibrionales bacterium]|nr:tRNA preQ1(34) S-adenosylmethionine ribosyltransferase-isomerase QueA [Vampirovibrionales bacterium]